MANKCGVHKDDDNKIPFCEDCKAGNKIKSYVNIHTGYVESQTLVTAKGIVRELGRMNNAQDR